MTRGEFPNVGVEAREGASHFAKRSGAGEKPCFKERHINPESGQKHFQKGV